MAWAYKDEMDALHFVDECAPGLFALYVRIGAGTARIDDGRAVMGIMTRQSAQQRLDRMADVRQWRRACRVCGCTDEDCGGCVEKTGEPCHWVEDGLCSACAKSN